MFNDSGEKEIYKFREDGTVLISVNGIGSESRWKFDPVDNSVEINADGRIYTFIAAFVEGVVFALQLDGTDEYTFLIDQANQSSFTPKTKSELIGYFDRKEKLLQMEEEEKAARLALERKMKAEADARQAAEALEKERIRKEKEYARRKVAADNELESLLQNRYFVFRKNLVVRIEWVLSAVISLLLFYWMVKSEGGVKNIDPSCTIPFIISFAVYVFWLKVILYLIRRGICSRKKAKVVEEVYKKYSLY